MQDRPIWTLYPGIATNWACKKMQDRPISTLYPGIAKSKIKHGSSSDEVLFVEEKKKMKHNVSINKHKVQFVISPHFNLISNFIAKVVVLP